MKQLILMNTLIWFSVLSSFIYFFVGTDLIIEDYKVLSILYVSSNVFILLFHVLFYRRKESNSNDLFVVGQVYDMTIEVEKPDDLIALFITITELNLTFHFTDGVSIITMPFKANFGTYNLSAMKLFSVKETAVIAEIKRIEILPSDEKDILDAK